MKLVDDSLDFHKFENILRSKTPYMKKQTNKTYKLAILRGLQKVNSSETSQIHKEPADSIFPGPQYDS